MDRLATKKKELRDVRRKWIMKFKAFNVEQERREQQMDREKDAYDTKTSNLKKEIERLSL